MKKLLSLLLCGTIAVSLLAGCGASGGGSAAPAAPAQTEEAAPAAEGGEAAAEEDNPWAGIMDYSKEATIHFTAFGNAPNDLDEVLDLINARLMKLCNSKLELSFISLADWPTKYPLALADDSIDLIYTSSWLGYATEAGKGAYLELDEDFRNKYLPETVRVMAPAAWKQASIDGHVYGVPRNQHDNNNYGAFLVRRDVLDKVGMETISNYDDLYKFALEAAKVMDPEEGYAYYAFPSLPMVNPLEQLKDHYVNVYNNMAWCTDEPLAEDCSNLEYYYLTDSYKEYILRMAEWAEAGVWPSTAINSTTHTSDQFTEGRSAFYQARFTEAQNLIDQATNKGYTIEYIPIIDDGTYLRLTDYSGDMTAILGMSKQPERAAVVLDILRNDVEINLLCQGGIEGRHYILNDDGTRSLGPEVDDYGGACWAWALRDMNHYPTEKLSDQVQAVIDELDKHVMPDDMWPFDGFVTNDEAYPSMSAELAVVKSIVSEYQYSFDLGVFGKDTEAKYDEFVQKLKDAGLDNLIAEWRKQAAEYMAQ